MIARVKNMQQVIRLRGLRQNNLKSFDCDIPIGKMTVVTGVSGSGKSSLVFDTLHAEGQRRYVETFSPYTRQFLELLEQPDVDSIENIRPSIALRQSNTVKTSRSTVGTMTELCEHFKNWFPHVATFYDPATGKPLKTHSPQSIWKACLRNHRDQTRMVTFTVRRPHQMDWSTLLKALQSKGYSRIRSSRGIEKLEVLDPATIDGDEVLVIQDRLSIQPRARNRFLDACSTALQHGHGSLELTDEAGHVLETFSEHLRSPVTGAQYAAAKPAQFSFNSPVGACPTCRGFGRVIEIDDRLVIPDPHLSIREGAIRPFQGKVYSECLRELLIQAPKRGIPVETPWNELPEKQREWVMEGDPDYGENGKEWPYAWYGVRRFFDWMQAKSYKMHVRVFLSKYRAYNTCPDCGGTRLKEEANYWKWHGFTLPELYQTPIGKLLSLMQHSSHKPDPSRSEAVASVPEQLAHEAIAQRLRFLDEVGLGYLTLDRASRTLSGGEVERVNLTACLGSSLVETLFILDEPSVGLHASDIDRLIRVLRQLTDQGNTVVVVEHDEAMMNAADHLLELGPQGGEHGGHLVFSGSPQQIKLAPTTPTGIYLSGQKDIPIPGERRAISTSGKTHPCLRLRNASKHNINGLDADIPLQRLVGISGVSGSGKSTLIEHLVYQTYRHRSGLTGADPATYDSWSCDQDIANCVRVDQSPLGKTPRSNPALYAEIWNPIREYFGRQPEAKSRGLTASAFSFNSNVGQCEHCQGLGYEKVEMQFLSEIYITCPVCEGKRFKPEILEISAEGKTVADILSMTLTEALRHFGGHKKIAPRLETLVKAGLGYLRMGQPINTLSGGEAQRLKLARYLGRIEGEQPSLLLLDEPTTGLHRQDIEQLVSVLHELVDNGHSLLVIEHQMDILKSADWIIEMGPGAGDQGGRIVFEGTPEECAEADTPSARYMRPHLQNSSKPGESTKPAPISPYPASRTEDMQAAEPEPASVVGATASKTERDPGNGNSHPAISIKGAREHNLQNIDLTIKRNAMTVVTGVSGSGKSTLAFDILFAEGQRRFLESVSAYARQFVEQMPRPDIDQLIGIPPTIAIEQRVTHGTRKSTVATITEVAQYLRLLYARIGVQHSPHSGAPVITQSMDSLSHLLEKHLEHSEANRSGSSHSRAKHSTPPPAAVAYLCAPLVQGRKGHHQPIADWATKQGYTQLRCDGKLVPLEKFQKLDRYREHDVEVVTRCYENIPKRSELRSDLEASMKLGKGSCILLLPDGQTHWLSTERADPVTGETYPELDPKHFSWNSPKGWCTTCRGYGTYDRPDEADFEVDAHYFETAPTCPDCGGKRLNAISRAVKLPMSNGQYESLPELLEKTPDELLESLNQLQLDGRSQRILRDIRPRIQERLSFLKNVGLDYLTLERPTATLSGGEAQRIRLAAQLGSTLSGVLYVLDEPSIGLHARDNARLLRTLDQLKKRGNTLVVVEHNAKTMQKADEIIDMGPGAGIHGGHIMAQLPAKQLKKQKNSITGQFLRQSLSHPLRGERRGPPAEWNPRSKTRTKEWLVLKKPSLRNLKGDDLFLPINRLNVIAGISGSGKSTLIRDLLRPAVQQALRQKPVRAKFTPAKNTPYESLHGAHAIDRVIEVDQEPIGKTPRSTPATYIGVFDIIRELFASLPEARLHGYQASTFSFNTKGGRCEACNGSGQIKMEMNFLPGTYVMCESCQGSRYGAELQEIRWNGKNIAETLEMSFEEAAEHFSFQKRLHESMQLMVEMGLGYLRLGQSSPTLSGGEAQRLKLVSELVKGLPTHQQRRQGTTARNLYILEEPTIGLHMSDCRKLIHLLHRLVDDGHTVIVIEHHLDIIREADYLVEIGPEGGQAGGSILHQDIPENLAGKETPTAPYLVSTHLQP